VTRGRPFAARHGVIGLASTAAWLLVAGWHAARSGYVIDAFRLPAVYLGCVVGTALSLQVREQSVTRYALAATTIQYIVIASSALCSPGDELLDEGRGAVALGMGIVASLVAAANRPHPRPASDTGVRRVAGEVANGIALFFLGLCTLYAIVIPASWLHDARHNSSVLAFLASGFLRITLYQAAYLLHVCVILAFARGRLLGASATMLMIGVAPIDTGGWPVRVVAIAGAAATIVALLSSRAIRQRRTVEETGRGQCAAYEAGRGR
jgi:hypothetical protein